MRQTGSKIIKKNGWQVNFIVKIVPIEEKDN